MFTNERSLRGAATRAGLGPNEYLDRLNKGLRYCWRCKEWHHATAFGLDSSRPDGVRRDCRESRNATARKTATPDAVRPEGRRWLPIVGYEGLYEVSDHGEVWTCRRHGRTGRLLTQHIDRNGYMNVGLTRNGKTSTLAVHRLLMAAFVGPCPPDLETRHLDGNRSRNLWPENLIYGTPEENAADKVTHGTATVGERNGRHKLTAVQVGEIHERWRGGESKRSLSRRFGVSPPEIRRILAGTAWAREFPRTTEAVPA